MCFNRGLRKCLGPFGLQEPIISTRGAWASESCGLEIGVHGAFRGLGFRVLGFRGLGFRGLGFRAFGV